LAAFLLFSAYLDEVKVYKPDFSGSIDLNKPEVFVGAMFGAVLVFIFSSLAIKAVGKAAYAIINNVREQFKNNPGIMLGTSKPNYGQCVDIATKSALREMIAPGILPVVVPVAVGVIFKWIYEAGGSSPTGASGAEVVGGLLMVGTIVGILMALFMNNGGGAWDNAKKYIETGAYGGKKSDPHKASVVGDTVGDPFKDTAGPSLHVLIKLLSTITLVLAPLFI
jgi:K(+)-stimulated pyrophosphate-energized sodium pump